MRPLQTFLVLALLALASPVQAYEERSQSEDLTHFCAKRVLDQATNELVREVFERKFKSLFASGQLDSDFWNLNKNLRYLVCDNNGAYETFVVPDFGVVFDYQMLGFLFFQSRALFVGREISATTPFAVYDRLITEFARQPKSLHIADDLIARYAFDLGVSRLEYKKMLANEDLQRRETYLFSIALNFLSLHERCHVALGHIERIEEILKLPKQDQPSERQQLELDADDCALELINSDEARFLGSPIGFFGVMQTIATQAIVSAQPSLSTDLSHPSTGKRLINAGEGSLSFIDGLVGEKKSIYRDTVIETGKFFSLLLDKVSKERQRSW